MMVGQTNAEKAESSTPSVQVGRVPQRRLALGRTAVFIFTLGVLVGVGNLLRLHEHASDSVIGGIWNALDQIGILDFAIPSPASEVCPQADVLFPDRNKVVWDAFRAQLDTDGFKKKAIEWLGGAVRIRYDNVFQEACDAVIYGARI